MPFQSYNQAAKNIEHGFADEEQLRRLNHFLQWLLLVMEANQPAPEELVNIVRQRAVLLLKEQGIK